MGYDPIQCTRAYLTLWKLVDRLFPGSRWLEIGDVPETELQANVKSLLKYDLPWCDEPNKLKEYAQTVLALAEQRMEPSAIANADLLRSELRDRALKYAEAINSGDSELEHTFSWEPRKKDGA